MRRAGLVLIVALLALLAGCRGGHTPPSGTPIAIYAGPSFGDVEAVQTAVAVMTTWPVAGRNVTVYLDRTPVPVPTRSP